MKHESSAAWSISLIKVIQKIFRGWFKRHLKTLLLLSFLPGSQFDGREPSLMMSVFVQTGVKSANVIYELLSKS